MRENEVDESELKLAEALKSLEPAASRMDPIAAAFTAGRRCGRRRERAWGAAAIVCAVLAICPRLMPGGKSPLPAHPASSWTVSAVAEPLPSSDVSALQLDRDVLDHGLAGLPAAHFAAMPVMTARDML